MEESCIPSNIQWITHFLTNPKITNQNTIGSGICSVKAWTTIIWYLCRLVYPREISQATMMAGSSRWQSAVIGGNGAWRSRMRTMNPKSNRTCLYRRSDRGPVLLKQAAPSLPGESVSRGFADRGALEGYPSHYTSLLRRNFKNCLQELKEMAYVSLVWSVLEYCFCIWDPYQAKDISSPKHIKWHAACFVKYDYCATSSVTAMLSDLGWKALTTDLYTQIGNSTRLGERRADRFCYANDHISVHCPSFGSLPMCPDRLRLPSWLTIPAETGFGQLSQGSRYGSHHTPFHAFLETSWRIGNETLSTL